jgi:hypothetical protein
VGDNIVKRDNEIVALTSQGQFGLPACNPNTCLRILLTDGAKACRDKGLFNGNRALRQEWDTGR